MLELKSGIYQHYKGKHCKVIGTALHSETGEVLVIYENCEDSLKNQRKELRARPYDLFVGKVSINGEETDRFHYISPEK